MTTKNEMITADGYELEAPENGRNETGELEDILRIAALNNDTRNPSAVADSVQWLAAEVRALRLSLETKIAREARK